MSHRGLGEPAWCSSALCGRLALKLDAAFLLKAGLSDGVHLAFELRQLSGHLAISADQERGWPEHHDGHAGRDLIVRPLLILGAR